MVVLNTSDSSKDKHSLKFFLLFSSFQKYQFLYVDYSFLFLFSSNPLAFLNVWISYSGLFKCKAAFARTKEMEIGRSNMLLNW